MLVKFQCWIYRWLFVTVIEKTENWKVPIFLNFLLLIQCTLDWLINQWVLAWESFPFSSLSWFLLLCSFGKGLGEMTNLQHIWGQAEIIMLTWFQRFALLSSLVSFGGLFSNEQIMHSSLPSLCSELIIYGSFSHFLDDLIYVIS